MFDIIYADPPWSYYNDSDARPDVTTVKGMRRPPYSVLSSKTIQSLDVESISNPDSILFLWTTDYHLQKSLMVMNAWGFEYKTIGFAWQKLTKNNTPVAFMGAYTMKSGIELCLLGTRGKPRKIIRSNSIRSLVQSVREQHSKKPDEVVNRINQLVNPNAVKVELFARQKRQGWYVWGNEVVSDLNLVFKK